jgi:hypothetical protein
LLWKRGKNSNVLMHGKIVFVKKWILVKFVLIDIRILFHHSYLVIYVLKFAYCLYKRQNKQISRICVLGVAMLSFFLRYFWKSLELLEELGIFRFSFYTTEFIRIYSCYIFAIFHRKNKNFFMYLIWSYFGILSFTWTEAGLQSCLYLIGRDSAWCTLGCQDKTRVGRRTV